MMSMSDDVSSDAVDDNDEESTHLCCLFVQCLLTSFDVPLWLSLDVSVLDVRHVQEGCLCLAPWWCLRYLTALPFDHHHANRDFVDRYHHSPSGADVSC